MFTLTNVYLLKEMYIKYLNLPLVTLFFGSWKCSHSISYVFDCNNVPVMLFFKEELIYNIVMVNRKKETMVDHNVISIEKKGTKLLQTTTHRI